jgi:hypothetical protein
VDKSVYRLSNDLVDDEWAVKAALAGLHGLEYEV